MIRKWVREWDPVSKKYSLSKNYKVTEESDIYSYKSRKPRLVCQRKSASGYMVAVLDGQLKQVHRLVAFSFVRNKNPNLYTKVIHLNKNREDNRKENLMWVSPVEVFRWRNNVLARTRVRKRIGSFS